MNIWIFCHYASTPDVGQYTGHHDLSTGLVERGHRVTIFASSFSHYEFVEKRLQQGETEREEMHDGVKFVWLRTAHYQRNDWRRVLSMVTYSFRAAIAAVKRRSDRPDVCIGVCVHPLAGASAWVVSKVTGSRFVYEIRDLWPLVLIETGNLKPDSVVAKALNALEAFLVSRADWIIAAWRHFDDYLSRYEYPKHRVAWIPQFADSRRLPAVPQATHRMSSFTVMYTGGHVYTMGLDVLLRAAAVLQAEDRSEVRIVLVGGGQEKDALIRLASELNLSNVEFRPPVPKSQLYGVMGEADAFVISLRALAHHRYGVCTNKLCDYLAVGRPIIYATTSSYNPVRDNGLGCAVPPEDPVALARAIELLHKMPAEERESIGRRAREFMTEHHERDVMVRRLERSLLMACAG